MTSTPFAQRRKFIINLGKALHKFGTPAYRLEAHLLNVAEILGLGGSFIVTPTTLTFVLWQKGEHDQQQNYVFRVNPGDLDLGSLARTDELVDELASGTRTLSEAIDRLADIESKPNPYSHFVTFAAFGISGGAFAMLMATSWNDVFWSVLLSLVVYLFVYWSTISKRVASMLEPLVSLVSALLVTGIAHLDPSINMSLVVLSSIIAFIPGLALTLGLRELAARDLLSGTARIMDAIMLLFKLYFGAVLGMTIGKMIWGSVDFVPGLVVQSWTAWLAVLLLGSSLVVMFKIRLKDSPWGIIAGFIAFSTSYYAAPYLGIPLGAFVGAFCVGVYSNLYARIFNAPAILVSLQGLVILVPGSKVYIGLNTMVSGENMLAVENIGTQSFLIFMSLVAGLIFSSVVLRPKRTL
ncbi:MAG: threonine/serine exporter family protein [Psychrobium sp.]|nr:threonine/serine exporter family protein [Psychrobium sp.]